MAREKHCIILTVITMFLLPCAKSIHLDFPAVFNFGDSNSDTGTLISTGFETLYLPYGQTYFHPPSGRYSDGRLIVDFLSNNLKIFFVFFLSFY